MRAPAAALRAAIRAAPRGGSTSHSIYRAAPAPPRAPRTAGAHSVRARGRGRGRATAIPLVLRALAPWSRSCFSRSVLCVLGVAGSYGMNQTVINDVLPGLTRHIAKLASLAAPIDIFSTLGGTSNWR